MGRVFLSLIEDTSGAHDLLVGGSTPASTLAAYGDVDAQHPRELSRRRFQARTWTARHPALRDASSHRSRSMRAGRFRLEWRHASGRAISSICVPRWMSCSCCRTARIRSIRRGPPPTGPVTLIAPPRAAGRGRRSLPDASPEIVRAFAVHRSALRLRRDVAMTNQRYRSPTRRTSARCRQNGHGRASSSAGRRCASSTSRASRPSMRCSIARKTRPSATARRTRCVSRDRPISSSARG